MAVKKFHKPIERQKLKDLTTEQAARKLFPPDMVRKLKEISRVPKLPTIIKKG